MSNPSNKLEAYDNMPLKATRNTKHPEINVGNTPYIYLNTEKTEKAQTSLWSEIHMKSKTVLARTE